MWSNEMKYKYMFRFPLKNLARKGLTWITSTHWSLIDLEVILKIQFYYVLFIVIYRFSYHNALRWMPWDLTDDKSTYRQISNIERTKSQTSNVSCLVLQLFCTSHWSQVLSREWKCSWSSADRRCSNYIWVVNNFIACRGVSYIRGFMVGSGNGWVQSDSVGDTVSSYWNQNFFIHERTSWISGTFKT